MPKCCVPTCVSKCTRFHRFPYNYELLYSIWVKRVQNSRLALYEPDVVYHRFKVCDDHFSTFSRTPGLKRGLKFGSLPTVNVPGFKEEPNEDNSVLRFTHVVRNPPDMVQAEIVQLKSEDEDDTASNQEQDPLALHEGLLRNERNDEDIIPSQRRRNVKVKRLSSSGRKLFKIVAHLRRTAREVESICSDTIRSLLKNETAVIDQSKKKLTEKMFSLIGTQFNYTQSIKHI